MSKNFEKQTFFLGSELSAVAAGALYTELSAMLARYIEKCHAEIDEPATVKRIEIDNPGILHITTAIDQALAIAKEENSVCRFSFGACDVEVEPGDDPATVYNDWDAWQKEYTRVVELEARVQRLDKELADEKAKTDRLETEGIVYLSHIREALGCGMKPMAEELAVLVRELKAAPKVEFRGWTEYSEDPIPCPGVYQVQFIDDTVDYALLDSEHWAWPCMPDQEEQRRTIARYRRVVLPDPQAPEKTYRIPFFQGRPSEVNSKAAAAIIELAEVLKKDKQHAHTD